MPLPLLLLLSLLGPGSRLQLVRGQTGVSKYLHRDDVNREGTDLLKTPESSTKTFSLSPRLLDAMGTPEQRDSTGPGTPEPATLEVAMEDSAGLGAGGTAVGNLTTELATQGISVTMGPLTEGLVTTNPPFLEALSTDGAQSTELDTLEALSTGPAAMEALTTQPAATEVLSTEPAATEELTTQPAATEVLSTEPAATEALTTQPAATEVLSTEPAATEALTSQPAATEVLSTEPAATEALTTQPAATEAQSTVLATTSFRGKSQTVSLLRSTVPNPTVAWDHIPVKQCLLAILILALLATIFLVCTVVLAVRLSRKNHTYPVRNYSPTEMVCISSLLPEGGEGPTTTANGGLPTPKGRGRKAGPGEDHDGDDLTLHSFLP
ncbi:P-selectin glycoprotein ligand 1 precursor [Equus caballus]|uniref:p-selectin glycoprotein ligand 1 n=1 Tax=Equus caballus TaxID=9796 RepID=A7WPA7_HORSE|nr:P-selectin glycoprotein ligand 1 precursor [Equus caballus]CAO91828.1 P-selectin glycoprotein ligand 1 precursor [Equus caballus]